MYSYNVFLHIQSLQQTVKQSQIVNTRGGWFGFKRAGFELFFVMIIYC